MVRFTGWKRTAIYLTLLAVFFTISLTVLLLVSLFALDREPESAFDDGDTDRRQVDSLGQSRLFRGRCDTASKANLWTHLAINIIGTCILASSNFFMQSLVAPTRQEVDKAHAAGQWVEIGVQSPRNCLFVSWRKTIFWFLFGLSSIPFHLIFNGCVLESKASNGFNLVVAAESFLHGAWDGLLPIEYWGGDFYHKNTVIKINESLSYKDVENNWEKIDLQDCIRRYNNAKFALTQYRHVVMVISNPNEDTTRGWSRSQVLKHPNDTIFDVPINATKQQVEAINPLWSVNSYHRDGTGNDGCQPIEQPLLNPRPNVLDGKTGEYRFNQKVYRPAYQTMQVQYCLSEKYEAPCRLSIVNSLLLSVCIMCAFKCLLCVLVLRFRAWGQENPLMTPGDAIASFIMTPDDETKDMCTLTLDDLVRNSKQSRASSSGYKWLQGPRKWQTIPKRVAGRAVPRLIWILSSVLIGSSLVAGAVMFGLAIRSQSIQGSRFAHDPQNDDVVGLGLDLLPLVGMTMVANLPQLILSICYMVYNGLFTRMLAEFEWSNYSVDFRSLRVTDPKGQQRSTYRLQLPYRWSVPLLTVSTMLHWVYSNCIYVSNYGDYYPDYPYDENVSLGLQVSTKAIFIALVLSILVAVAPFILATVKLPGSMVISGGNSVVISAACHCEALPPAPTHKGTELSDQGKDRNATTSRLIEYDEDNRVRALAMKRLRWGKVSTGNMDDETPGHLSFGTEEQGVVEPVEGEYYSGRQSKAAVKIG